MQRQSRPARVPTPLVCALSLAVLLAGCGPRIPEPPPPNAIPSESPLGALVIPRSREGVLNPGEWAMHPINFEGRKPAEVTVSGNRQRSLALHVYDPRNRIVASDTQSADGLVAQWEPQRTATFRIVVHNTDSLRAVYRLKTN